MQGVSFQNSKPTTSTVSDSYVLIINTHVQPPLPPPLSVLLESRGSATQDYAFCFRSLSLPVSSPPRLFTALLQGQDGDTSPCDILKRAVARSTMPGGKDSVALIRTAAMHFYTWRGPVARDSSPYAIFLPTTLKSQAKAAATRQTRTRQAEGLLMRAIDLEPFHWPTMAALAFLLLQCGVEDAAGRAAVLLENASQLAGRSGELSGYRSFLHGGEERLQFFNVNVRFPS